MKSSWELTKQISNYHFDNFKNDPEQDRIIRLGHIEPTWADDVAAIVEQSRPSTWKTRGYKGQGVEAPREDQVAEENDLEAQGYGKDYVITHINWQLPDSLKAVVDNFALKDCMSRLHIQKPGEVWNLHIDKLQKWAPENPETILRVMIHLTDWEQGHFWSYGNYVHTQWRAGDVTTFDWANLPHSTANAGHNPRVTLQLTGVRTEATDKYIKAILNK